MKSPFALRLAGIVAAATALLLPVLLALPALAADEEYKPVTDAARVQTDPNPFIIIAYGATWAVMMVYVIFIARGFAKAEAEVAELKRRVASGPRA